MYYTPKITFTVSDKVVKGYTYHHILACCYYEKERIRVYIDKIQDKSLFPNKLPRSVANKMHNITVRVDNYISQCQVGQMPISLDKVREIILDVKGGLLAAKSGVNLLEMLRRYEKACSSGEITYKGRKYGKASMYYISFFIRMVELSGLGVIDVNQFGVEHLRKFQTFMIGKELSQNTISNYNTGLITFFKNTYDKWHKNDLHKQDNIRIAAEEIDYAVYYTVDELKGLSYIKLTGQKELARDLFVYGSFTCMRHSDLSAHSSDNIRDGFIIVPTIKTGEAVTIPIHPIAKKILDKYKGRPPKMTIDNFNFHIKNVVKDAGFTDNIAFSRTEGGLQVESLKPKWKLTSSHTMRRSFATNAIKAGMPHQWVMKLGGWKSYGSFKKYIRLSNMDIAVEAAKHAFFKG